MPTPLLRILVFDLPPLLRDLVCRSLDADDRITSVVAGTGELRRAVCEDDPDVVIAALDEGALGFESRRLFEGSARLRVLGLGVRDGRAVLYELRPGRIELGEVVPHDLPGLIRKALAPEVAR